MTVCGIFRICLNVLFESCKIDLVDVSKSHCMYDVPVIYDFLTFGLVLCCNIVSVFNLVGKSTPSKQRIQSIFKCLEWINILLICSAPYYYNSFYRLHLLCSGDIEINPGPTNLKICHINIRSLSPVKLIPLSHYSRNAPRIHHIGHIFQSQRFLVASAKFALHSY